MMLELKGSRSLACRLGRRITGATGTLRSRLPTRSVLNALHRRAGPLPKTQGVFILYEFHSLQINERKLRQSLRSVGAFFMDLRGVEPLSENPSITASPITVCYFAFAVPSVHRKQTRFEP